MRLLRQLRALFRRGELDAGMSEELQAHLELQTRENIARGMSPDDARYAAQRAFGGIEQIKERSRDARGFTGFDELSRDLRFAARMLRKHPGFTVVVVLTLALGIGANTALFSLIDDLLLRPLPVQNPHELVLLRWVSPPNGMYDDIDGITRPDAASGLRTGTSLSYFIFDRLRGQPGPLRDFFAFAELAQLNVSIDRQPEVATGQLVSGGYFAGLGVSLARGRPLTPEDDRANASPAVVISHRYWQRRFGGDDAAVGKTIRINDVAVTVVGITRPEFKGTLPAGSVPDISLPMSLDPLLFDGRSSLRDPAYWWINVMGRLPPGVRVEEAQAQLEPAFIAAARDGYAEAAANLARGPGPQKITSGAPSKLAARTDPRLRLDAGARGLMGQDGPFVQPLRVLMAIVGVVLLIACVNVANLLLARAGGRAKEMAMRLSLGASRLRLIRQLLTESLLLALLGGACGLLIARWGRDALLYLRPIDGVESLALDGRVLGFTTGVSVLTGVLFGLVPAWRATRASLNDALKTSSGTSSGRSFALGRSLMIAQVALSVVLLVGAGLFLRTLVNLRQTDTGFNGEHVLLFRVDAALNGYKSPQIAGLFDRVLARLGAVPGVRSAAHSRHPLLSGSRRTSNIVVPGANLPPGTNMTNAIQIVSPGFLPTMEIPVLLGRNLDGRDIENAPRVAVVNQTFARRYFPEGSPVGRTFFLRLNQPVEIVGLARDARYAALRGDAPPTIYLPFRQEISGQANFEVRTVGDPLVLAGAIRSAVHEVDPDLPIFELRSQDEQVNRLIAQERTLALLSAVFGAVALLLTCIGLYGLLAHEVSTRTREIGIRMALGAQLRGVVGLVLTEGLCLAVIGIVIGLGAAIGLSSFVAKMLFGVPPADPVALAAAPAVLLIIAGAACWLPARRAAKVDPVIALRAE